MTADAPSRTKRSGFHRCRRIISLLPLLAVLVFLFANLIISGPWTRRWIASAIEKRLHLPTQVGSFAWSPWRGCTVHSLLVLQPDALRPLLKEPLIAIQTIRFMPEWRAAFHGKLEINRLEIDSPRLVLPIELIAHLIRQVPVPPPAVVIAANPPPAPVPTTIPTPAIPPSAPTPVPPVVAVPPAPNQVPTAPVLPKIPPQPTLWIDLKNTSFALVSAKSGQTFTETTDVTGSIPLFGDPAKSSLQIGSISAAGETFISQLKLPLQWDFPMLSIPPFETEIHGQKCLFSAKLAYFAQLPLQLEAQVPAQLLGSLSLPFSVKASAQTVAASARFRGLLLSPNTWDGELRTELTEATFQLPDHLVTFDRGSSVTLLRGGTLSCVNAQLVSDELSVLGNGTLYADGRLAAAVRVVSSPETTRSIAERIFPLVPGPRPLTELSSSQRAAFDMEAAGTLNQAIIQLGKNGTIFEIKP